MGGLPWVTTSHHRKRARYGLLYPPDSYVFSPKSQEKQWPATQQIQQVDHHPYRRGARRCQRRQAPPKQRQSSQGHVPPWQKACPHDFIIQMKNHSSFTNEWISDGGLTCSAVHALAIGKWLLTHSILYHVLTTLSTTTSTSQMYIRVGLHSLCTLRQSHVAKGNNKNIDDFARNLHPHGIFMIFQLPLNTRRSLPSPNQAPVGSELMTWEAPPGKPHRCYWSPAAAMDRARWATRSSEPGDSGHRDGQDLFNSFSVVYLTLAILCGLFYVLIIPNFFFVGCSLFFLAISN